MEIALESNICHKNKLGNKLGNEKSILTRKDAYNKMHIGIGRCQLRFAEMQETITGVAKS